MIADPLACAQSLNRLPFVRWDRFIEDRGEVYAYGWIERVCEECGGQGMTRQGPTETTGYCPSCHGAPRHKLRADFVVLRLGVRGEPLWFTTSSAARSEEIAEFVAGPAPAGEIHLECQRIETELPLVENAVRL